MPKITIDTKAQDVHITIETDGKIVMNEQVIQQESLPLDEAQTASAYNQNGEKLASESQRYFLERRGQYKDGMTAQEAYWLIKETKEREQQEKAKVISSPDIFSSPGNP